MFIIKLCKIKKGTKRIEKYYNVINLATDFHFLWNSRSHYKDVIALKFMGLLQPISCHLKSSFTYSKLVKIRNGREFQIGNLKKIIRRSIFHNKILISRLKYIRNPKSQRSCNSVFETFVVISTRVHKKNCDICDKVPHCSQIVQLYSQVQMHHQ